MLNLKSDSIEFVICSHCSSIEYIEDYPSPGNLLCTQCGHESEKIRLKIIEIQKEILDTCPFCGKGGEEDDTLFEKDDILVFKCKKCGKLDGYKFFDFSDGECGFEGEPNYLLMINAKNQKKHFHTAQKYQKFKKVLRKREKDPLEKCKKQLQYLIKSKRQEILVVGINNETIRIAKLKAQSFIERKGPLTSKKLSCLFAAALLITPGNKLTERQLEKIFGVTRKTIRKWKEILRNTLKD